MANLKDKKIMLVDGFKIRNTLDTDFMGPYGHSERLSWYMTKWYIPKDEIWIDHILKDEIEMFLKIYEIEKEDKEGIDNFVQEREYLKEKLKENGPVPEFVKKEEIIDGIRVKYVNGGIVRKFIEPAFIFGGHGYVYEDIPKKEIWLDIKILPEELPFVYLHERTEYELMAQGKDYDNSHDFAIAYEKEARRKSGGAYPGDEKYPWYHLSNEEIIRKYYVEEVKL